MLRFLLNKILILPVMNVVVLQDKYLRKVAPLIHWYQNTEQKTLKQKKMREREILKQKGNKKVRNFSCMELEKCKPDWTYLRASVKKVMRSVEDEMLESWTLLNYTHRQVGSILLKRLKWALTFRANIYIIVEERSIVVEYHLTCSTWLITSAVNLSLFHQCPSSSSLWSSCLFCHSLIPSLLSLSPVSYWFDPVVSTNTQPGWTASQAYDAVKCQVPLGRRD